MSNKELEFELLQVAKHSEELQTTKENDEELTKAQEIVKELNSPYKEQSKQIKVKHRFIALLLKEKTL